MAGTEVMDGAFPASAAPMDGAMPEAFDIGELVVHRGAPGAERFILAIRELRITAGEHLALVGPSGSGKTTLLDTLAFIAQPSSVGAFRFGPAGGRDLVPQMRGRNSDVMAQLRRRHIGYVPQVGGLLPALTVRANVELPRRLLGLTDMRPVDDLLSALGMTRHARKKPTALSVGERQRVAIARALAHQPAVICADEPTAALDPYHSDRVMDLFTGLARDSGATLLVVSHEQDRVSRFGLGLLRHEVRPQGGGQVTLATAIRER